MRREGSTAEHKPTCASRYVLQAVSQHAYMLFYSRRKYKPRAGGKGDAASGHRRAGSTASSASGGA